MCMVTVQLEFHSLEAYAFSYLRKIGTRKIRAVCSSVTLVSIYSFTHRYYLEDQHRHLQLRENHILPISTLMIMSMG